MVEEGSRVQITEIEGEQFIENGMVVEYLRLVIRKGKEQLNGVRILYTSKLKRNRKLDKLKQ
jgi:hypothetical protein